MKIKKSNLFIALSLFILVSAAFAYTFFYIRSIYLYSHFVFNQEMLLWWGGFFLCATCILLFILLLCRKSTVAKVVVLAPVTLVVLWSSTCLSFLTVCNFWRSEVTSIEEFHQADPALERQRIAGLSIEDITKDYIEVEDFEYAYQAYLLHCAFTLRGKFVYSEERYNKIKEAFLSDPEFTEALYNNGEECDMTGYFTFTPTLPQYQTKTSIDDWKTLIIKFNDNEHSFYFCLEGDYET